MPVPLLVEQFDRLPQLRPDDDPELWAAGAQPALQAFCSAVQNCYTEGTLQRLLVSDDPKARRAAVLALGQLGTLDSNAAVAAALHDPDSLVQQFAADALWELWFRGGNEVQNRQLREAISDPDADRARATLDLLIRQAPGFAEVFNQRAIWHFKRGEFTRAVEDCEMVLRLNPFHFGAAAGLGQCQMKLGKYRAALRAFRTALDINPGLAHLADAIRTLEESLGRNE